MKKIYEAPVAEKVDFDYEENVVASGAPTNEATRCVTTSCKQEHTCDWGHGGGNHGGGFIIPIWFPFIGTFWGKSCF